MPKVSKKALQKGLLCFLTDLHQINFERYLKIRLTRDLLALLTSTISGLSIASQNPVIMHVCIFILLYKCSNIPKLSKTKYVYLIFAKQTSIYTKP